MLGARCKEAGELRVELILEILQMGAPWRKVFQVIYLCLFSLDKIVLSFL